MYKPGSAADSRLTVVAEKKLGLMKSRRAWISEAGWKSKEGRGRTSVDRYIPSGVADSTRFARAANAGLSFIFGERKIGMVPPWRLQEWSVRSDLVS
jgi:hypothetical protein